MRVLLDEDLPIGLARHLQPHEVRHVAELGWKGKSNGDLLRDAVAERFDVLLMGDAHMPFQQDLGQHDIAVVQVRVERLVLRRLITLAPQLVAAIDTAPRRTLSIVPPPPA